MAPRWQSVSIRLRSSAASEAGPRFTTSFLDCFRHSCQPVSAIGLFLVCAFHAAHGAVQHAPRLGSSIFPPRGRFCSRCAHRERRHEALPQPHAGSVTVLCNEYDASCFESSAQGGDGGRLQVFAPLKTSDGVRRNASGLRQISDAKAKGGASHLALCGDQIITPLRNTLTNNPSQRYRIPVTKLPQGNTPCRTQPCRQPAPLCPLPTSSRSPRLCAAS